MAENFEAEGEDYSPGEFERKWTNPETNELMMKEFDKLAHENFQELAPGLSEKDASGKTIVFAITKNHATRLAKILNDLHPEANSNYAAIITYVEVGPQDTRIDKSEYQSRWEQIITEAASADPVIAKIKAGDDLSDDEQDQFAVYKRLQKLRRGRRRLFYETRPPR